MLQYKWLGNYLSKSCQIKCFCHIKPPLKNLTKKKLFQLLPIFTPLTHFVVELSKLRS